MSDKMQKIIITIFFVLLLNAIYYGPTKHKGYFIKPIKQSSLTYLRTTAYYSMYFQSDKKSVLYVPGYREVDEALNPIASNPEYQKYYNFYPQESGILIIGSTHSRGEIRADLDFWQMCQVFCIVNPKKGEIYSIKRTNHRKVKDFPRLFEKLKDW